MPNDSAPAEDRVTIRTLQKMRESGDRISMLTAYDYPTAKILDESGVDILLVGDSLSMVVGGHDNTLAATMDQMIYHGEMVARAATRALVVIDLPFPEGQLSIERSILAGVRVLKETRAAAIKIEGGAAQADRIAAVVAAGIPVMAHIGMRPQNVHVQGGYRVQRNVDEAVADARAVEAAGAFAVLIECVTAAIGDAVRQSVNVPVIGIGAGPAVDGQVLVTPDLIGLHGDANNRPPKFVRPLSDVRSHIKTAARQYIQSVRDGSFPSVTESY